jgi:DNA-binding transcriptional LysR family regulator
MELRHLRYFIAIAEEHSFRRAAVRLGIQQPPLSLQIRHLERETGAPSFRRHARGVELTDAGKLLLEEARVVLNQVEQAKSGVARRARGESGQLNVGSSGATDFHPLIPAIIREYGMQFPGVDLVPEASNTALMLARRRAGTLDAAFVRPPIMEREGLVAIRLVDEDTVMALPRRSRRSRAKPSSCMRAASTRAATT